MLDKFLSLSLKVGAEKVRKWAIALIRWVWQEPKSGVVDAVFFIGFLFLFC